MAAETQKGTKKDGGNFIKNVRTYLKEVRDELNKVTWPTREDVIMLTRVVLLVTIASSLLLGALSVILGLVLNQWGPDYPIILVALFIAIVGGTIYMMRGNASKSY